MIICPRCNSSVERFRYNGYHVQIEGVVEIDPVTNRVKSTGPVAVKACVKPGYEFTGKNVFCVCPHCNHKLHYDEWIVRNSCVFTGDVTDFSLYIDQIGSHVYIQENLKEIVPELFVVGEGSVKARDIVQAMLGNLKENPYV